MLNAALAKRVCEAFSIRTDSGTFYHDEAANLSLLKGVIKQKQICRKSKNKLIAKRCGQKARTEPQQLWTIDQKTIDSFTSSSFFDCVQNLQKYNYPNLVKMYKKPCLYWLL